LASRQCQPGPLGSADAKQYLIAALETGDLAVPESIIAIEKELKGQYREALKAAKPKSRSERAAWEKAAAGKVNEALQKAKIEFKEITGYSNFQQAHKVTVRFFPFYILIPRSE